MSLIACSSLLVAARTSPTVLSPASINAWRIINGSRTTSSNVSSGRSGDASHIGVIKYLANDLQSSRSDAKSDPLWVRSQINSEPGLRPRRAKARGHFPPNVVDRMNGFNAKIGRHKDVYLDELCASNLSYVA